MIKNILGCDFKYENDKLYRLHKQTKQWMCCNDKKPEKNGYMSICINKKSYRLHRLIYKYFNENWDITFSPENHIDHIDINKLNNTIENLRILTASQNSRNIKKNPNSSSKYRGVYKSRKKWRARIKIYGKMIGLGSYDTEEEASEAYEKKYNELMDF